MAKRTRGGLGFGSIIGNTALRETSRGKYFAAGVGALPAQVQKGQKKTVSRVRMGAGSPTQPNTTQPPTRRSTVDVSESECYPAFVTVKNEANASATKVSISSVDFPGLLRVVAWVLNGLELVVVEAELSTADGMATQELYVTDLSGNLIEDTRFLSERISQFVQHCVPDEEALQAKKFVEGKIVIDNEESDEFTVISIDSGNNDFTGLLLSIASTIAALGINVHSAKICTECEQFAHKKGNGRFFRFLVRKIGGEKLDYVDASGTLFTLNLVIQSNSQRSTPIHASRIH
jgi:hypothetical protein